MKLKKAKILTETDWRAADVTSQIFDTCYTTTIQSSFFNLG